MALTRTVMVPKRCPKCEQVLGEDAYAPSVWALASGYCRACQSALEKTRKGTPRVARNHRGFIVCPTCTETLGQEHFTPATWVKGSGKCLECHTRTYGSTASPVTAKKAAKYVRERRKKRAAYIQRIKHERGCMYCRENHPAALDFHHRDKSRKVASVSQLAQMQRSFALIDEEIAKCDVVCANCHRKTHYAQGGTSYWSKDRQYDADVIEEAEAMREERNRKYPVHLKLA